MPWPSYTDDDINRHISNLKIDTDILQVGVEAGLHAAKKAMEGYNLATMQTDTKKNDNDLVTEYDVACSDLIIDKISSHFPEHCIISEEKENPDEDDAEYTWIIDPIDGTMNFTHKFPDFVVSIGILKNNKSYGGIIVHPYTMDTFYCIKGNGCWLNANSIKVDKVKPLNKALNCFEFPYYDRKDATLEAHWVGIKKLYQNSHNVLMNGSTAYALANVAAGRLDSYLSVSGILNSWDTAAGIMLVQEAGGNVIDLDGNEIVTPVNAKSLIAGCSMDICTSILQFFDNLK